MNSEETVVFDFSQTDKWLPEVEKSPLDIRKSREFPGREVLHLNGHTYLSVLDDQEKRFSFFGSSDEFCCVKKSTGCNAKIRVNGVDRDRYQKFDGVSHNHPISVFEKFDFGTITFYDRILKPRVMVDPEDPNKGFAQVVLTDPVKVSIKTLTGKSFSVEVNKNARVLDLKREISSKHVEWELERQKLIFAGKLLSDFEHLDRIGYKENSNFVIHLVYSIQPTSQTNVNRTPSGGRGLFHQGIRRERNFFGGTTKPKTPQKHDFHSMVRSFNTVIEEDESKASAIRMKKIENLLRLNKLVTLDDAPMQEIFDCGIVMCLGKFLLDNNERGCQEVACLVLNNICGEPDTEGNVEHVVQTLPGLISILLSWLEAGKGISREGQDNALNVLANIAGDGPKFRDLVFANKKPEAVSVIKTLAENEKTDISIIKGVTFLLTNLFRKSGGRYISQKYALPLLDVIEVIIQKKYHERELDLHSDLLWSLSSLSDTDDFGIDFIFQKQLIVDFIFTSFSGPLKGENTDSSPPLSMEVLKPTLRLLGNFSSRETRHTDKLIESKGLKILKNMIVEESLTRECIWALSNIMAGTTEQIQSVIDEGLYEEVIREGQGSASLVREACFFFSNGLEGGTKEQREWMMHHGVVGQLIRNIGWVKIDNSTVIVCIEGLSCLLVKESVRSKMKVVEMFESDPQRLMLKLQKVNVSNCPGEVKRKALLLEKLILEVKEESLSGKKVEKKKI